MKRMKKIVIIKIGAIGDAIMSLPTLVNIKKREPDAQITWIGGESIEELFQSFGLIDRFIAVSEEKLYGRGLLRKLSTLSKVWLQLFCKKFDQLFIFHHDTRYKLLGWFCFAKRRVITTREKYLRTDQYHAYGYLKAWLDTQSKCNNESLSYPKIHFSQDIKNKFIQEIGEQKTILLFPGGTKNPLREQTVRRWPISYYRRIATLFLQKGYKIAIAGGKSDKWILPFFSHLPIPFFVGNQSLLELAHLIAISAVFITHDTGPMHLAKLTDTPTLALFGPVNPHSRYAEETEKNNIKVIWGGGGLACRPCYDGKEFPPCTHTLCMRKIQPDEVFEKGMEILGKKEQIAHSFFP